MLTDMGWFRVMNASRYREFALLLSFGIQDMEANIAGVTSILLLFSLSSWFRSSR